MTEDWLRVKQKLGRTTRISKLLEECNQIILGVIPIIHSRFVITDFSDGRKNEKTELDDRRSILCYEKIVVQKH